MSEKLRMAGIVLFFVAAGTLALWWQSQPIEETKPVAVSSQNEAPQAEPKTPAPVPQPATRITTPPIPEIKEIDAGTPGNGAIAGQVYDEIHGHGIANATIELRKGNRFRTFVTKTTTDDEGRYSLPDVSPGMYKVSLRELEGYGQQRFLEDMLNIAVAENVLFDGVDFPKSRGLSISGTVVDQDGAPINDVFLSATREEVFLSGNISGISTVNYDARKASGTHSFQLYGLPISKDVRLSPGHRDYYGGVQTLKMSGRDLDGIQLMMTRGASISGVIVDTDGKLVPEVELHAISRKKDTRYSRKLADPPGGWEITGLPAGTYDLYIHARDGMMVGSGGSPLATYTLSTGQVVDKQRLEVDALPENQLAITGTVEDTQGTRIPHARIVVQEIDAGNNMVESSRSIATKEDGTFFIPSDEKFEYTLQVIPRDYVRGEEIVVAPGTSGIKLTAAGYGAVSGNVIYAQDGKPVTDFKMALSRNYNFTIPDRDWTWYRHPEGKFLIPGVRPGVEYYIYAKAPGYPPLNGPVRVQNADQIWENYTIRISEGVSLTGTIKNEVGTPVSGIMVFDGYSNVDLLKEGITPVATSDIHGRFAISSLPPGRKTLSILAPDGSYRLASVDVLYEDLQKEFSIPIGGYVAGRVTMDGQPIVDVRVGIDNRTVRTDEEGYYKFKIPVAGPRTISAKFFLDGEERNLKKQVDVPIQTTATLNFQFDAATSSIEGRILIGEDQPVAGQITLTVTSGNQQESHYASVGEDGLYRFKNLRSGNAILHVYSRHIQNHKIVRSPLAAGENLKLDTLLFGGSTVRCTVSNSPERTMAIGFLLPYDAEIPTTADKKVLDDFHLICDAVDDAMNGVITLENIPFGDYILAIVALHEDSGSPGDGAPIAYTTLSIDVDNLYDASLTFPDLSQ